MLIIYLVDMVGIKIKFVYEKVKGERRGIKFFSYINFFEIVRNSLGSFR